MSATAGTKNESSTHRRSVDVLLAKVGWMNQANCVGKPADWLFPDEELVNRDRVNYTYGLALCQGCPVRAECLDYAMTWEKDARWRFGVWGGMTPHQRWLHEPAWRDRRK